MISVIIPARNGATTLPECLQALSTQEDPGEPWEVIVVDDGSEDNTGAIAAEWDARLIRHSRSRGAGAARNSGLAEARGELIFFTDADCVPTPNWLREMKRPFDNPAIAGCKGIYATAQTELVARFVQLEYEDKYDLLRTQSRIDFIDTYSAGYRRKVLVENGGFDPHIFYVEDQELSFRLAAKNYGLVFQPDAVVFHHHSSSLTAYMRKKFNIGYWKTQILRRYPQRAVQDSHTPQVMKVQIVLTALILLSLAAGLLLPPLLLATMGLILAFHITTIPFVLKAWPKDRMVALVARCCCWREHWHLAAAPPGAYCAGSPIFNPRYFQNGNFT
jgi:glycosyltransferase involved in cell wall biosynthesis